MSCSTLEKLREEISHLTDKQKINFTWRCVLRTIPYLVYSPAINNIENKQNYLYSIFHSLDICACVIYTNSNIAPYINNKAVEGTKYGIGVAQDLASGYNKIAEWTGLPQVPKLFLKK